MIYNTDTGEIVYDQEGCIGTRLYEAGGIEYVHLAVKPGCAIPEHSLPLAVSFCVLKGNGVCTVSGEPLFAAAGDMLECPPGALRGWRNDSDALLEVLVVKREVCS